MAHRVGFRFQYMRATYRTHTLRGYAESMFSQGIEYLPGRTFNRVLDQASEKPFDIYEELLKHASVKSSYETNV